MREFAIVADAITNATGDRFELQHSEACGGGCINEAWVLRGVDGRRYFLKANRSPVASSMLTCEAEALAILARAGAIRVPLPICRGEASGLAFLVLEYLPLISRGSFAAMGESLAQLHATGSPHYGWHGDNYIGATLQQNRPSLSWLDFLRDQRLAPQIEMAQQGGLVLPRAGQLLDGLAVFFEAYQPQPSLLHGDLWSGNAGFLQTSGEPVLFDPASYYGDRECDIAFTELFGGFGPDFYRAYAARWPLAEGYAWRKRLYNLYHELNHFNLFGGAYGSQARATLTELCAQL